MSKVGLVGGDACLKIFSVIGMWKYIAKSRAVYLTFMDLENAYDRTDREGLWTAWRLYELGGRLLKGL